MAHTESNKIIEEVKKKIDTSKKINNIIEESSKETILEDQLKIIEEAISGGMQMRSFESKKAAAVGAIAVSIAKKRKDPLYDRLKHFRGAWKEAKNQLTQRYGAEATMKWQAGQH